MFHLRIQFAKQRHQSSCKLCYFLQLFWAILLFLKAFHRNWRVRDSFFLKPKAIIIMPISVVFNFTYIFLSELSPTAHRALLIIGIGKCHTTNSIQPFWHLVTTHHMQRKRTTEQALIDDIKHLWKTLFRISSPTAKKKKRKKKEICIKNRVILSTSPFIFLSYCMLSFPCDFWLFRQSAPALITFSFRGECLIW